MFRRGWKNTTEPYTTRVLSRTCLVSLRVCELYDVTIEYNILFKIVVPEDVPFLFNKTDSTYRLKAHKNLINIVQSDRIASRRYTD